jgi:hypothetical protein
MISRHFNAEEINKVCNDPSVKPWLLIPGIEEVDISHFAADDRNYILMGDGGGCWLHYRFTGIYEGHVVFVDGKRSKAAHQTTGEALRYMFVQTDCMEIYLRIPGSNLNAQKWAEAFGFSFDYSRLAWPELDGLGALQYYSMTFNDWLRSLAGGEDQKREAIFQAMLEHGQTDKGFYLYNKWALLVGKPFRQRVQ